MSEDQLDLYRKATSEAFMAALHDSEGGGPEATLKRAAQYREFLLSQPADATA